MGIKKRLVFLNFLQFFVWGCWLITIGAYWFQTKHWSGTDFGTIFSTMGIASLFMPAIAGIVADRWVNAERLYGSFHLIGAVILFFVPKITDPSAMFWIILLYMIFYMPTIALAITVSYSAMKSKGMDIVKEYPPIRVWGTIGFIIALWIISLSGVETSAVQFYVASAASLILGMYSFTLPACPPLGKGVKRSLVSALGLDAFALFKKGKMALFFVFAMLLGAALQLTNAYGDTFLHDFSKIPGYKHLIDLFNANFFSHIKELLNNLSFSGIKIFFSYILNYEGLITALSVKYPAIIMSISQISETLFILTIPFFLRKFGIKKVMLFSMIAWVLRFGLFAYGDPAEGLWMIILSCIIYGMAFDFFNISGSIYVETQSDPAHRASAQGLFMMMSNGFGAVLGSRISGVVIDTYFKVSSDPNKIQFDWHGIWLAFAGYAIVVAVLFAVFFRYKHDPKTLEVSTP
ncbi:MAG: MFS transporter [Bacteroidetes bacterium]|nr:MAG: MFS transporter [Bacteroidota bacterium]